MRLFVTALLFLVCSPVFATTCWISEYATIGRDEAGNVVPAPEEPSVAAQSVATITATEQSSAFHERTHLIRVFCDIQVFYKVGPNPTATTSTDYLPADKFIVLSVVAGRDWKIAFCDADCT